MHIGSGLNTVSSMYRQQKGNNMKAPVSAEKTFYTAETPKVYQIFTTDNMRKREAFSSAARKERSDAAGRGRRQADAESLRPTSTESSSR